MIEEFKERIVILEQCGAVHMKVTAEKQLLTVAVLIAIISFGTLSAPESSAADYFCWIKAGNTDANITVRDMDRDGNPLRGSIWKGQVKSGQRQRIESTTGRISYSYARAVESRKRGANYNPCTNGNTIQLK